MNWKEIKKGDVIIFKYTTVKVVVSPCEILSNFTEAFEKISDEIRRDRTALTSEDLEDFTFEWLYSRKPWENTIWRCSLNECHGTTEMIHGYTYVSYGYGQPKENGYNYLLVSNPLYCGERYISISNAEYNDNIHYLMSQYGFETESYGRSCFKTRTRVNYITKNKPVIINAYVYNNGKFNDETEEIYVYDNSDVVAAYNACKDENERMKREDALKKILSYSKDGKSAVMEVMDGSCGDTPQHPNWECVWSFRTACTSDHRQGYGHTYLRLYLLKDTKGIVKVAIPDEYKGAFIGKGGCNIKNIENEYKIKVKLV